MVCLQLIGDINRDVRAVAGGLDSCGKRAFVAYASTGAGETAAEWFTISGGVPTSAYTLAGTADYTVTDAFYDRKFKRFAILDVLTTVGSSSVRIRVTDNTGTVLYTRTFTDADVDTVDLTYGPNLRSGSFSCDGRYVIFSYITALPAGGESSTTTVRVLTADLVTDVLDFTFSGRTNDVQYVKVSCGSRKARPYVVFASAGDVGSDTNTILYTAPAYLNVYHLKFKSGTVSLAHQRKLPQYGLGLAVQQPKRRGEASLIVVGTRLAVKNSSAAAILQTITNNLVLSTSQHDTAELRGYVFTGRKLKCLAARKRGTTVLAVEISNNDKWVFDTELIDEDPINRFSGEVNLFGYPEQCKFTLADSRPAPFHPVALDQSKNGKYLLVAGSEGAGSYVNSILIFRTNRKKCCY